MRRAKPRTRVRDFDLLKLRGFDLLNSSEREGFHEGEGGIQGEGSGEEARGLGVGGVRVCKCRDRGAVDFKADVQCIGHSEDVALARM